MSFNQKKILAFGTFLLFSFLLFFFVIFPLWREIKEGSRQLFLIKKDLALLQQKTIKFSEVETKYRILEPDLERTVNLFLNPELPIDFFQFLEKTAKDSNLIIDISLVPPPQKETSTSSLNFQLSLAGSFPDCLKFLERLETAPYLIRIDGASSRRLSEAKLRKEKYSKFSLGDVEFGLLISVLTK